MTHDPYHESDFETGYTHERTAKSIHPNALIMPLASLSSAMLFVSGLNLVDEPGPTGTFKALLLAVAGGITAFAVTKIAVEELAPMAALGFRRALFSGLLMQLFIGFSLFVSTYCGWTIKPINQRILQNYSADKVHEVNQHNQASLKESQLVNSIRSIAHDLEGYALCERQSNCITQRRGGGAGPVAKTLSSAARETETLADLFAVQDEERERVLKTLNRRLASLQTTLDDADTPLSERRTALKRLHTEIGQNTDQMAQMLPLNQLRTFSAALMDGIELNVPREVQARVNAIRFKFGESLSEQINTLDAARPSVVPFPKKAGVFETLRWIKDYLSLALVIGAIEIGYGLILFLATFTRLSWRLERQRHASQQSKGTSS